MRPDRAPKGAQAAREAEEARVAMMSAHTMGRGVVRTFDVVRSIGDREDDVRAASEQAEALRAALAAADLAADARTALTELAVAATARSL